jgi:hypothetical protein
MTPTSCVPGCLYLRPLEYRTSSSPGQHNRQSENRCRSATRTRFEPVQAAPALCPGVPRSKGVTVSCVALHHQIRLILVASLSRSSSTVRRELAIAPARIELFFRGEQNNIGYCMLGLNFSVRKTSGCNLRLFPPLGVLVM